MARVPKLMHEAIFRNDCLLNIERVGKDWKGLRRVGKGWEGLERVGNG